MKIKIKEMVRDLLEENRFTWERFTVLLFTDHQFQITMAMSAASLLISLYMLASTL